MDITGKKAIVTGGGRGIGRAISLELARNGADVAIGDLNLQDAVKVAEEIETTNQISIGCLLDVTNDDSVDTMVTNVVEMLGRIDILVNNAGVIAAPGWEDRKETTKDDWDLIYEVNVKGMVRVTESVTKIMKKQQYGKVVNISSIAGRIGNLTHKPYGASKASVINLTQSMALELAPFDINVNAIYPGLLWTPMWRRIAEHKYAINEVDSTEISDTLSPREIFDRSVKERIPLGREQTPEDIGYLSTFLASDFARNITGQTINVSGGSHMN
jgi:NAD(P)-dependent dehydrogenase (short-subunit alcohol dehydrogenase family)